MKKGRGPVLTAKWVLWPLIVLLSVLPCLAQSLAVDSEKSQTLSPVLKYISSTWDVLERSMSDCKTFGDSKVAGTNVLYVPADLPRSPRLAEIGNRCNLEIRSLPKPIERIGDIDPNTIDPQGLLYLDHPYVVPGGRFNEMYGWDSYFIVRGLIRDGRGDLAQGMVENFSFEIEHYGGILNANRSYYLSRSQPPLFTSMVLAVYEAQRGAKKVDHEWLERAYRAASKDYQYWISKEHLAGTTGLSRYYDLGNGPAPESVKDEAGNYQKAAAYFLRHPEIGRVYLAFPPDGKTQALVVGESYSVRVCDSLQLKLEECQLAGGVSLNADYYKGDRAMRESGYDVSFRFAPFGAATHHFAPVCLNSLLYKTETDLEHIARMLGYDKDADLWRERGQRRRSNIQKYLWNPGRGLYFDFDFTKGQESDYEYVTTFLPLWAGVATPEQSKDVVGNLKLFERRGGLVMSPYETGAQWDFPYAWAPNQLFAAEGMRRYGFNDEADRVSREFLSMIADDFRRTGTMFEKYDGVARSSNVDVRAGYTTNVVGFGWTNGVFLELLAELSSKSSASF